VSERAGSAEAFDTLVRARAAALLRTAFLLTGDAQQAEDLLQTALTTTYLHWSRLRDEQAAEAYTRRVMVTTYARWWRRRWRGETPTADLPEDGSDPYERLDEQDRMARGLQTLTRRQRACVVLRYYEDLSEQQIAVTLGMAPGTVKSTTARALARLREYHAGERVTS
jgi:RNA polymerase sigma-70 factor, ECF subfamily